MTRFGKDNLQNIKDIFEEKTGTVLEQAPSRRPVGRVLLVAAILAALLSLTCVAAAELDIGTLFGQIFRGQQGAPLSGGQSEYIDSHVAAIGESLTREGVTVTVKGAISDGTTAYLLLDITAREDMQIGMLPLAFNVTLEGLRAEGQAEIHISGISNGCQVLPDDDGQENTTTMLIQYNVYQMPGSHFTLNDGQVRTLRLKDLFYHEAAYPYTKRTVAEGEWVFSVAFTAVDDRETELLAVPMTASYTQISGQEVQATIHSFRMKGLSGTFYYTLAPDAVQEAGDFGVLRFVMQDGSTVRAYPQKAGQTAQIADGSLLPGTTCHYCTYVFEAPVQREKISALYLGETAIDISVP